MPPPVARERALKNTSNFLNITKFQPHLKYCTLNLNAKTSIEYACYSHEVCCLQGCCAGYSIRTVQSWQYWSPIIFCIVFIYFLSNYCIGAEKRRDHAIEIAPHHHRPRRCLAHEIVPVHRSPVVQNEIENVNVDQFLEHLIQEYRIRYPDIDMTTESHLRGHTRFPKPAGPPCYDEALLMPKPKKNKNDTGNFQENVAAGRSTETRNEEALPTYENAVCR